MELNFIVIELYELMAMMALADVSVLNKNATWNLIFTLRLFRSKIFSYFQVFVWM